jgi:hypothetical protein
LLIVVNNCLTFQVVPEIIKHNAIETYGGWRFQVVPEIIKYHAIETTNISGWNRKKWVYEQDKIIGKYMQGTLCPPHLGFISTTPSCCDTYDILYM